MGCVQQAPVEERRSCRAPCHQRTSKPLFRLYSGSFEALVGLRAAGAGGVVERLATKAHMCINAILSIRILRLNCGSIKAQLRLY